jgi:hypothetical protein
VEVDEAALAALVQSNAKASPPGGVQWCLCSQASTASRQSVRGLCVGPVARSVTRADVMPPQCAPCGKARSAFRYFKDHAEETGCAAAFSPLCPGCATAKGTRICGGCWHMADGAYVDLSCERARATCLLGWRRRAVKAGVE